MAASILKDLFSSKDGITIGELMNIDTGRQERASLCNVQLLKTYHELKRETVLDKLRKFFLGKPILPMYYVIFKFKVSSGKGHNHIVMIKANPDFNLVDWHDNKVQIYCDCPDFTYRVAYNLNRRGGLFITDKIKTSLGEAITQAPKGKISHSCKHSFAALQWLISNYSYVMRTI